MRWQLRRGLLHPLTAKCPGSAWWRTVNERLLRDQTEALELVRAAACAPPNGRAEPAEGSVGLWIDFLAAPTPAAWYRAHNASVVGGYADALPLAWHENAAERFFMNVALTRVLYAHALVAAPSLALGPTRPLAPRLGDPRGGLAGWFLSLGGVLPDRYPLTEPIGHYLAREHPLARALDLSVILPRLGPLYTWSADVLQAPALRTFVRDGEPAYATGGDVRWPRPLEGRAATAALHLATRPSAVA